MAEQSTPLDDYVEKLTQAGLPIEQAHAQAWALNVLAAELDRRARTRLPGLPGLVNAGPAYFVQFFVGSIALGVVFAAAWRLFDGAGALHAGDRLAALACAYQAAGLLLLALAAAVVAGVIGRERG